jgi:hypothetical protein
MTFLFKLLKGTSHHWNQELNASEFNLNGEFRVLVDPKDFHEGHEQQ